MPNTSTPNTAGAHGHGAWAEVRARDQVVRYHRSGVGRTVLILCSHNDPEPLWPELLETLGAGYRLIVPEPPVDETDLVSWLADFLEGLGVSNVIILAANRFCIPALELALLEGDQVARLVLVPQGNGRAGEAAATLVTQTRQARVPLLIVPRGQPASETVSVITGFLGETGR